MAFTSAQLAAEITNDPKAFGYAAFIAAKDRAGLAAKLNATYGAVTTVWRTDLSARDLLACVVQAEVAGALFTQVQWLAFQTMLLPGAIDASKKTIRDQFEGLFAGKPLTLANMTAAAKVVSPTRGEELWGHGTRINDADIAASGVIGL